MQHVCLDLCKQEHLFAQKCRRSVTILLRKQPACRHVNHPPTISTPAERCHLVERSYHQDQDLLRASSAYEFDSSDWLKTSGKEHGEDRQDKSQDNRDVSLLHGILGGGGHLANRGSSFLL